MLCKDCNRGMIYCGSCDESEYDKSYSIENKITKNGLEILLQKEIRLMGYATLDQSCEIAEKLTKILINQGVVVLKEDN